MVVANFSDRDGNSEEIEEILKQCDWSTRSKTFEKLSFQKLRKIFIPQVLGLYNSEDNEIEPCFTKDDCKD